MKSTAPCRVDPSIVVSLVAAGLLLGAFGSWGDLGRTAGTLFEAAWLYLTNTKG